MNNYHPPEDEEMLLGHFTNTTKKRIKKSLMEWIFFESSKQLFVNIELIGTAGFLCACCDGIPTIRYNEKKSPNFIDSQWIIDEKIGGSDLWSEMKRLTDEVRNVMMNKKA